MRLNKALASLLILMVAPAIASSTRYLDGQFIRNGAATIKIPTVSGTLITQDGTGTVTATTFVGALTGNASTATSATSATSATTATTATTATNATNGTTASTSTNASYFPLFAASSSNGNQPFNLGTGLTFNPSTNNLATTTFTGAHTGNTTGTASGNTTYTANQYGVVLSGSGNTMSVLAPDSSTTKVLTSGGASANPSWATVASAPQSSYDIQNVGITATVAANALTINLVQGGGSACSSGSSACLISFRNATATTGTYTQESVTGALSIVVPSGASLGTVSGTLQSVYVYGIDNAGTVELAVSGGAMPVDEGSPSGTTIAISAGSTARSTLYSTTARATKPVRLIGRVTSVQATAGTWATAPAEISLRPLEYNNIIRTTAANGATFEWATIANGGSCSVTVQGGSWITAISHPGTGLCDLTIAPGTFSGNTPYCVCSTFDSSVRPCGEVAANSTSTNIRIEHTNGSFVDSDGPFSLICATKR